MMANCRLSMYFQDEKFNTVYSSRKKHLANIWTRRCIDKISERIPKALHANESQRTAYYGGRERIYF